MANLDKALVETNPTYGIIQNNLVKSSKIFRENANVSSIKVPGRNVQTPSVEYVVIAQEHYSFFSRQLFTGQKFEYSFEFLYVEWIKYVLFKKLFSSL